ncbi:MAG: hypothetical protein ACJ75S_02890 [Solirubrobacterales bacterium]
MDRLMGWVVVALAMAIALPTVAAIAQSLIPALVMAIVGLAALRLLT